MTTYYAVLQTKFVKDTLPAITRAMSAHKGHGLESQDNTWDIRDTRIKAQRAIAYLNDLELWEPENFTEHNADQLAYLKDFVKSCKERENALRQ